MAIHEVRNVRSARKVRDVFPDAAIIRPQVTAECWFVFDRTLDALNHATASMRSDLGFSK